MDSFYRIKREGFPESLADFGYAFNEEGKLRNTETGEGFQYEVKMGDHYYNEKHYEALGDAVTCEIYKMLESKYKLKRAPVPYDVKEGEERTFIFHSEDALTNPDKLLVLVHGSGFVKAGMWSRRLIINDSLKSGSQFPFIEEAVKEGYGVLLTNSNDNCHFERGLVRGSEHPEAHMVHVWKHYISHAKARHIAFIAHSNGGRMMTLLFKHVKEEFLKRVFAVALTDSNHYFTCSVDYIQLIQMSRNWVSSKKPLDRPCKTPNGDIIRVSAGVKVHEMTSWASFTSIFKFLKQRLAAAKESEEGGGKGTSKGTKMESYASIDQGEISSESEDEQEKEVKKLKMDTRWMVMDEDW